MNNNAGVNFMIVVNDAGDFALRTDDGDEFFLLSGVIGAAGDGIPNITYDPAKLPAGVAQGTGLAYVWKYRNRLYFIQKNSMTAWYLPLDAVGGVLLPIYLAGAASTRRQAAVRRDRGRSTAGDGTDDKCVFVTDLGEVLIFTGSNPSDAANWRQEGRYQIGAAARHERAHAARRRPDDRHRRGHHAGQPGDHQGQRRAGAGAAHPEHQAAWREEVAVKRDQPWTIKKWDEYGGIFVAAPGGTTPDNQALPCRQQRDRRVVHHHLGRDLLAAQLREHVFRHPDRHHHAGRPRRLRRRLALHGNAGRRLGDVPVGRRADGVAPGARHFLGAAPPSRSSRNCPPRSTMS